MSTDKDDNAEFCRLLNEFQAASESGDVNEMESLAAQLFSVAASEQAENPSKYLGLRQEASEHESAARWKLAEIIHRRASAMAESEGNHHMAYSSHSDLSRLYEIRGMHDCALQEAKQAVEAARKSSVAVLLSTSLGDLSCCHLMNGDIASAIGAAEDSVQAAPAGKMTAVLRARVRLIRARCRMADGQTSGAKRDLDDAWQLLAPFAQSSMFAGVQSCFANWWEIAAKIRIEAKDLARAAEALGEAVRFRRRISQLPQLDGPYKYYWLANALKQYGAALLSAGDLEASAAVLEESRSIQDKIKITL